jgi:hypothetical protein
LAAISSVIVICRKKKTESSLRLTRCILLPHS